MKSIKQHAERKHALLSASGATRWMNCTPSARMEEHFPDKTSVFAEEGTLAHEIADLKSRYRLGQISKRARNSELKKLQKHKLYTDEMEPEVEKYLTVVFQIISDVKKECPDAEVLVEQRLDFSHLVEKGFGTGDMAIIADGVLHVIDLKYGKGVMVEAEDNPQLRLYGSGALHKYELSYDIEKVQMHIVQPRLEHYSTEVMGVEELTKWGEEQVKPKAKIAYAGEGDLKVGDWCKFCKAKPLCRAQQEHNLELAKLEFQDPYFLTDEEALAVFESVDSLVSWAESVKAYVLDTAHKGEKQWKGYKVVEGQSRRRWGDQAQVEKTLKENGFKPEDYSKQSLEGLTKMKKLVGKDFFKAKLKPLIIKPEGKPRLVPDSDPRPAIGLEQAKQDFE